MSFLFALLLGALDPQAMNTGDFIFMRLNCGPTCSAIEKVTQSQLGTDRSFSHVGMVERTEASAIYVHDAWPEGGVRRVSLKDFLSLADNDRTRIEMKVLRDEFREAATEVVQWLKLRQALPYDPYFLMNSSRFYCSGLLYEGWKAVLGTEAFLLRPMFFGELNSPEYRIWQEYYLQKWMPVPTGEPGASPLSLYVDGSISLFIDDDS